jgi:hypothetical protein
MRSIMRSIMRPMLLVGALACCSLTAFALDSNIAFSSNNHCNVALNGNMQLKNKVLAVTLDIMYSLNSGRYSRKSFTNEHQTTCQP